MPNYSADEQDRLKDYSFVGDGTDKTPVAANDGRRMLFVQCITGEDIALNFGVAASLTAQGSILIRGGDPFNMTPYTFISSSSVHIIAPSGAKVTVKEGSL